MVQRVTARQEECLRLTAFLTDKEIATRLGLSETTVKKHVHEACRRLGVNRRKAALATLERKVPLPTKDPMVSPGVAVSSAAAVTESDDGSKSSPDASPLDVGRSGSRAGRVQPAWGQRPGSGLSATGSGGRRGTGDPARTVAAGAQRGLGDGAGRGPERRLGYRPPPEGWGPRLLIIAILVVVCALIVTALADMVVAYAAKAQAIGDLTTPSRG